MPVRASSRISPTASTRMSDAPGIELSIASAQCSRPRNVPTGAGGCGPPLPPLPPAIVVVVVGGVRAPAAVRHRRVGLRRHRRVGRDLRLPRRIVLLLKVELHRD